MSKMEIHCKTFDKWYPGYTGGNLSDTQREKAVFHLKECQVCRTRAHWIETMLSEKIYPESDPYFYTRFESRLSFQKPLLIRGLIPYWIYGLAVMLSVVIGIKTGQLIYRSNVSPAQFSEVLLQEYAFESYSETFEYILLDDNNQNP